MRQTSRNDFLGRLSDHGDVTFSCFPLRCIYPWPDQSHRLASIDIGLPRPAGAQYVAVRLREVPQLAMIHRTVASASGVCWHIPLQ